MNQQTDARISPDSRVAPDTGLAGPVRVEHGSSAEDGSAAEATAPGRCVLRRTTLARSSVVDVRAASVALQGTAAVRAVLTGMRAEDTTIESAAIRSGAVLQGSAVRRSLIDGSMTITDSTLIGVRMQCHGGGHSRVLESMLAEASLGGQIDLEDCTTVPAHWLAEGQLGRGEEMVAEDQCGRITAHLDGILGDQWRNGLWTPPARRGNGTEQPRALIADSTIARSWITGGVRGSTVTGSVIAGRVTRAQVTDSAVSATGTVLPGAKVTGSVVHGTVEGHVAGVTIPAGAWIAPAADILSDSQIAVGQAGDRTLTAHRTSWDGVAVMDDAGGVLLGIVPGGRPTVSPRLAADPALEAAVRDLAGRIIEAIGPADPLVGPDLDCPGPDPVDTAWLAGR